MRIRSLLIGITALAFATPAAALPRGPAPESAAVQQVANRTVSGTVEHVFKDRKILMIKTADGKLQTFIVQDAAASKLERVKQGDKVTMEVDEKNQAGTLEIG